MSTFVWDSKKEAENIIKHGVDFLTAQLAFQDPKRQIRHDPQHSSFENRFLCFGKIKDKVLTVRFTYRNGSIRIIGAGYWRKGEKIYETEKD